MTPPDVLYNEQAAKVLDALTRASIALEDTAQAADDLYELERRGTHELRWTATWCRDLIREIVTQSNLIRRLLR